MTFHRIKDLRDDHDWTQQNVADRLFISRRAYGAYETGERAIPVGIVIELAKIYNVSIDYILGLTDERKPYPRAKR